MDTRVVPRVASAVLQVSACSDCESWKEPQKRQRPPSPSQTLLPSLFLHVGNVVVRIQDTLRSSI